MCPTTGIEHASSIWLTVITVGYLIFALQILSHMRWEFAKMRSVMSLGAVVIVFLFCSLAGYATSVLPPSYWLMRDVLHAVLSCAIIAVVMDRRASKMMARMMERDLD